MNYAGWRALLGIAVGLSLGGCTIVATAPSQVAAKPAVEAPAAQVLDRLYFGRSIPQGGEVNDQQWAQFLAEVVTPRFPAGFSVFAAQGQWRAHDGQIVHEPAMVIEIVHRDDPVAEYAIEEIATSYKQCFAQEAVLRVREPAAMKLY